MGNDCWNIKDIEFFNDKYLQKLGIKNEILRQRFLKQCERFKSEMNEFENGYGINKVLYKRLAQYGLVSLSILCNSVDCKDDLEQKYKITNVAQRDLLWNLIQTAENGTRNDQTEGVSPGMNVTTGASDE